MFKVAVRTEGRYAAGRPLFPGTPVGEGGPAATDGNEGIVFNIIRFAVNDGPGIRTTVFFKGCPAACWWCHNPESQRAEPELVVWPGRCSGCGRCAASCRSAGPLVGAELADPTPADPACRACGDCVPACPAGAREIAGRRVSAAALLAEVERDRVFFEESGGGVTFSGGEPLAQADFLLSCLRLARRAGLHTAVDTCGHAPTEKLLAAAEVADLLLYDLKLMDPVRHRECVGVDNRLILANLAALSRRHEAVVVRLVVVPGVTDDEENASQTASFLREQTRVRRVDLLPYHAIGETKYTRLGRQYRLAGTEAPSEARLRRLADIYAAAGLEPQVGG